jgi:hypothetical protein
VFLALEIHADIDGYCWPLVKKLQEVSGINRRNTIFAALRKLESVGAIRTGRLQSVFNGRRSPLLYRIGGEVELLPTNAKRLYFLLGKRHSTKPSIQQGSQHSEVSESDTSQNGATYRKVIPREVAESDTSRGIGKRYPERIQKELPQVEAADAVAVGAIRAVDRGFSVLESDADGHRHPPSPATANSDDDCAPKNKSPSNAKTKAAHDDPSATENQRLHRLKAKALANIKAEYKNEFSDEVILLAFEVIDDRAQQPIRSTKYYETAFRNDFSVTDRRSDRVTEIRKEVHVGEGPEIIPDPNYVAPATCAHCGRTEKFHNKTLHIKTHIDPHWIEHPFRWSLMTLGT